MVDLKKVSEEVKSNEPETVQYQITQSDEDENEILIWEEVSLPSTHFLRPPLSFLDSGEFLRGAQLMNSTSPRKDMNVSHLPYCPGCANMKTTEPERLTMVFNSNSSTNSS